jgi:glycosidase
MILRIIIALILIQAGFAYAQKINRIDPEHWYAGLKRKNLQLLINGEQIGGSSVAISYPGIRIEQTHVFENNNYIAVDLALDEYVKPGKFTITLTKDKKLIKTEYEIKERRRNATSIKGFTPSDLIYLLMPDRFSNGDPSNDKVKGMLEQDVNRNEMYKRHGGDLQGVINHLDYLTDLGVTALWMTPFLINDQEYWSYHGYATTDHYRIEPRFGGNDVFAQLVAECHRRGMKFVMDYIYNHIGDNNYLVRDLPSKDWLHQWPEFTRTNYRPNAVTDPYRSKHDSILCVDGWFDKYMPDLNQKNPFVQNYFIQNTIWWVEFAQIDGFRFDTYPYNDNEFMIKAIKALKDEYPNIGLVGETWEQNTPAIAYWQSKNVLRSDGQDTYLQSLTDFMLCFAIKDGLREPFGWNRGFGRIYYQLSEDILYQNPYMNVIFLDNHDISRILSELNNDFDKWKQAITMLMTLRGIPMLYYGTEILMDGMSNPDGLVRKDFPGGWPGDSADKFMAAGRSDKENEAFNLIRTLAQWRKTSKAITEGKLMQFVPNDNTWVYFRYTDNECVMVLFNSSNETKSLDSKRFYERISNFTKAKNIISGETLNDIKTFSLLPNSVTVLEFSK